MHPSQALDKKADLLSRAMGEEFRAVVEEQVRLDTRSVNTNGAKADPEKGKRGAMIVATQLAGMLKRSHCYYVAPEMTDLILWASLSLEDTDHFRMDELPTTHGFAYFEKPLPVADVRGKMMLANAVCWFPARAEQNGAEYNVTAIVYFNDGRNTPDDIYKEMHKETPRQAQNSERVMGGWGMIGIQGLSDGIRVGPKTLPLMDDSYIKEIEEAGQSPHEFTNMLRMLHAYWLLMNQTVTHLSEAEVPRAMAKRARRMEIPDRVTIVALRRVEGQHHGESDVDWQYRWLVRGHWRWQHVSEHHPSAERDPEGGFRARVWVRPHVKGPEDKPFHLTEKVYALVR